MRKLKKYIISILITCFIIFLVKGAENFHLIPSQDVLSGRATPTPLPTPLPKGEVIVTKVVDGDTIHVNLNGHDTTIRIIGIDTPETVDPRKPVQCMGKEASNRAKELLMGKIVFLESDPSQGDLDKYGRLLRYVFINGSDDYGLGAIVEGLAHEYTYDLPYKYQTEYKKAENAAREAKIGLWADNACN
jgi:micrococcal nuclease